MTDIMKNGLSRRAFLGLGATAAVAAGAGLAGCSPAASAGDVKAGGDAAGSAAAGGETQYEIGRASCRERVLRLV